MEVFERVLEAEFNVMPSDNTKYVAYKYPNNILDINFEDKVFKAKYDWFIDNETVLQEDHYYYGEHDGKTTCTDTKLRIS